MTLGIMQPYFFPYLGYFSLISATDKWIVFDDVQYIRHGWVNRNRILKPGMEDWQYVKVPLVKHSRGTFIKDVQISNNENWREKIIAQLKHYKKKAPYYSETVSLVDECLNLEKDNLTILNTKILSRICKYLGIKIEYQIFSKMDLVVEPVNHPSEWALNIALGMKAETYINPPNAREMFNVSEYANAGVKLQFLENRLVEYNQMNPKYFSGLSIIDVLMFNSPKETLHLINDYTLD